MRRLRAVKRVAEPRFRAEH